MNRYKGDYCTCIIVSIYSMILMTVGPYQKLENSTHLQKNAKQK